MASFGAVTLLVFGILRGAYAAPLSDSSSPSGSCDDIWAPASTSIISPRNNHTAVWTGTEMIVWGGFPLTSTGARFDPVTDSWVATSTVNAPTPRLGHTSVWTGSEMIIWGGERPFTNTGGRYDPVTDTWVATSTVNAPTPRDGHTAIWTGRELIVWGGVSCCAPTLFNTGGRYDPTTDTWVATSTVNAPTPRDGHTAIWTGSEMIIWGGGTEPTNTGGRYDPATDSWSDISTIGAPSPRFFHSAVWTSSEMIVWGGFPFTGTGGRFDPVTDSWSATSTMNNPGPRQSFTAVWTGTEMIVWGGFISPPSMFLDRGGRYRPATDSWVATSTIDAPSRRREHTAVWTGNEMIVWGGLNGSQLNTGGRYCASAP